MTVHIKKSFSLRVSLKVLRFLKYWLIICFMKGPGYRKGSRAGRGRQKKTLDIWNLADSECTCRNAEYYIHYEK